MEFSYADERRFVWARITGPWTIDEICSRPEPILDECLSRKQDLLLVDLVGLTPQPATTLDRFKLGSSIISFAGKLRKIAAVATSDFLDPERFGERVARNRSVNVRVFDDLETAKEWLLKA